MGKLRRAIGVGLGVGVLLASATGYRARYVNPYRARLERISLHLPPEHACLAGFTIGFLTDTHVGPFTTQNDVARAADLLAREHPDLVLFGGDYISESPRYISATASVLGAVARAAPYGGIAVLGNHDLSLSADKVIHALEREQIKVLRNQAAPIVTDRGTLWIAGIDETLIGRPDVERTFASIPDGSAALALWHEPIFAAESSRAGAFAQLSGHTHGGQVRLPFVGALALPADGRDHVIGISEAAGMPVYTSRGVGVYRPPIRLRCPPEVTLITLQAPRSQGVQKR
jgi:predicted MPP superfamily phosphohydrolase